MLVRTLAYWSNWPVCVVVLIPLSWLLGVSVYTPLIVMWLSVTLAGYILIANRNTVSSDTGARFVSFPVLAFVAYALFSFFWSTPANFSTTNVTNPLLVILTCLSIPILYSYFSTELIHPKQGKIVCLLITVVGPILLLLIVLDSHVMNGPLIFEREMRAENGRLNFSLAVNQNPNSASYFFGIGVLVTLRALRFEFASKALKLSCWIGLIVYSIMFTFCGSISAGIGLLAAVVVNASFYKDRTALISVAVMFIAFLVGLPLIEFLCECSIAEQKRGDSAAARLAVWRGMIELWLEQPLLGHGMFTPLKIAVNSGKTYSSHSILLHQLAGGGIIGIMLVIAIMIQTFNRAVNCARLGEITPLCWLIFVSTIVLTHKHMVFLPEPYLWLIVWGPLLAPHIVLNALAISAGIYRKPPTDNKHFNKFTI